MLNIKNIKPIPVIKSEKKGLPLVVFTLSGKPLKIFNDWKSIKKFLSKIDRPNQKKIVLSKCHTSILACANPNKPKQISAYGYQWRKLIHVEKKD